MIQTKLLTANNRVEFQTNIDKFLTEIQKENKLKIKDIQYSTHVNALGSVYSALIIYEVIEQ